MGGKCNTRWLGLLIPVAFSLMGSPGTAGGQNGSSQLASETGDQPFFESPYLYLRHWAYPYVDLLLERGVIEGLSPVVRPYRRIDVARAVLQADEQRTSAAERGWLEWLRREFGAEIQLLKGRGGRARVAVELSADGTAMTQSHRDPLRPAGSARIEGALQGDFRFAFPGIAGESRQRSDSYYKNDPQFPNDVVINGFTLRAEDAYVEVQLPYVRLMLGRLYRNWAPSRVQGTVLSDYAYSFSQAALRAGTDVLSLSLVFARLDDFPDDVRRYVSLHRVDFQPSPNLALYVAEAILYAGQGRDFELEFLNPLSVWVTQSSDQRNFRNITGNNALLDIGFWWRPNPFLVVFGDLMIDDLQFNPFKEAAAPGRYAFYAGLVLPRVSATTAARVSYTQVSNLAYRTFSEFERYTSRDLGLARDFSDYDLLTAEVDWFPEAWLRLIPRVQLLRRGEGDFRDPLPSGREALANAEAILSGTVETTVRVSLGGQLQLPHAVLIQWDAGPNFVSNADNASGESESTFVGRLTLRLYTLGTASLK